MQRDANLLDMSLCFKNNLWLLQLFSNLIEKFDKIGESSFDVLDVHDPLANSCDQLFLELYYIIIADHEQRLVHG